MRLVFSVCFLFLCVVVSTVFLMFWAVFSDFTLFPVLLLRLGGGCFGFWSSFINLEMWFFHTL
ncbi:hypothetical protein BC829DRAFT_399122, partial [Chytridium lagenaria]